MHSVRTSVRGRVLSIGVVLALIMTVTGLAPAAAATVTNSWRAQIGSAGVNGTATIQVYARGAGSIALKLAKLRQADHSARRLGRESVVAI